MLAGSILWGDRYFYVQYAYIKSLSITLIIYFIELFVEGCVIY